MENNQEDFVNNTSFYSEAVEDILSDPPKSIFRWGNTLLLVFILMIFFLSWLIKYPDVIVADTIVTTRIPPQKEYAKITGSLDTILVRDNQFVRPSTALAVIENTTNYNDIMKLESILDTIKTINEFFVFPVDNLSLSLGEVEKEYNQFESNYINYFLNRKLQPFNNEVLGNSLTLMELKRRLNNLKKQKELQESELNLKTIDIERNRVLFKKGVISAQEYEKEQIDYSRVKQSLKSIGGTISQLRESINNSNRISTGTIIEKTKEEVVGLKKVIQSFNQLKRSIKDWKLRYVFQSKITGNVSFINFWYKNQNVNQNELVFTVIPKDYGGYIAKLKAPSQNSGKIKVGQKVFIKLYSYPYMEFGMLIGRVKKISIFPDKNGYYLIDVTLPKGLLTSYNKKIAFKQEMRGDAEIITEDLRLINRFLNNFKSLAKNN